MASIQDVAQLAQVSTATASRALSRPDMVASTTRERVLTAARELPTSSPAASARARPAPSA
ncbi:LacI family DNA-binding transcriptional regulator [Deinococcus sp. RM]|uniref:LacI family DNA-binding transcriptional regulator n=1 Tax=Deinococcus sp. RM TaxID=2316359 RepID=UPI001F2EBC3E|nr:LacI family DNA-binding transcriptional regulator [Deinococcus sp. RM]